MDKDVQEVTAFAIDDNGKGIVRVGDKTLFISGLLKDEKGQIEITYAFGKIVSAVLIKRLSDSPDRVKPACPYYDECGGCNLMHLSYEKQLIYKQEKVKNLLHKFAKIDMEVNKTVGMDSPYHFRNKIQVPVRTNEKGEVITGFFKEDSHDVVPIESCLIEDVKAKAVLDEAKKLIVKYGYQPYDETTDKGLIRHIIIKSSLHFDEIMAVIVTSVPEMPNKLEFAKDLVTVCPSVKTVVQNVNQKQTNVIMGNEEHVLLGSGKIRDSIFNLTFLISSKSFYQTNPLQTVKLYKLAIDGAQLKDTDNVLDAYSGTGTIGLCASAHCRHVTLVEIVEEAVEDAKLNAQNNKIDNVRFVQKDCTRYLMKEAGKIHFNVVFMDPPRKGTTPEFIDSLKVMMPERIVYISCNPVTLARDLGLLKDKYDVTSVTPVDMFPQSSHVETVVALSLRKNLKEPINAN